jgi:prepilin-type N-terminal cleavage/methylation domain-containing protein
MTHPRAARPGYTLMEMVLALAIAVLLLAALYVALNTQLYQTKSGRNLAEQTNLVRMVVQKMSRDIQGSLGPTDTRADAITAAAPSEPAGGGGSSSGNISSPSNGADSSGSSSRVAFNMGVQGDATYLSLYVSKVPPELGKNIDPGSQPYSDLRRVTYWLAMDNATPLGLARQELPVATADEALNPFVADDIDQAAYVFAPEVINVSFEYFDGTSWLDSWDGSAESSGPPVAIAFKLTVRRGPPPAAATDPVDSMVYRHVVFLPTANGATSMSSAEEQP